MKKSTLFFAGFLGFAFALSAQTIVNTGAGNKHAVLEEFTGIKCGNCPGGHTIANNLVTNNPGTVHVIAYGPSNSSYTDPAGTQGTDFRRTFANAFYSAAYCSPSSGSRFMPSAFINRKLTGGNILQSSGSWTSQVNTTLTESSPMNIGIKSTYSTSAQTLTIDVEVFYTSTVSVANNIHVAITEDDLTSDYQSGSSASAANPYVYKHLFRENVTTGQWGDAMTGSTTQGSLYTKQFVFNLAGAQDPINIAKAHVTAFVTDNNSSNKEIYTGISVEADGGQASTGVFTSVDEIANAVDFNVFPNPSNGQVSVNIKDASNKLEVYNVLGETVYTQVLNNTINQKVVLNETTFTSNGIYFVKVSTENASTTEKVIIH